MFSSVQNLSRDKKLGKVNDSKELSCITFFIREIKWSTGICEFMKALGSLNIKSLL